MASSTKKSSKKTTFKKNSGETVFINGSGLDVSSVYKIAFSRASLIQVAIDEQAKKVMAASRQVVLDIAGGTTPVYGINTGFGALSNKHIRPADLEKLQINLIRSHCTGVGRPFGREVVRAIMLLRANCLCRGFSGINPEIVELLLDFINHGITPVVFEKGSVGASGDLAPLSHIALALIGEGEVEQEGKIIRADFAIESIKKRPAKLGPKDGLALINGTSVMSALGAIALHEARNLYKLADISAALTLDAVKGTDKAYHPEIANLKPHPGQLACTYNLNKTLAGSKLINSHRKCAKVQDPYSLRCVPQVHGACRQTLMHTLEVVEREMNSVTDNPLVLLKTKEVISGGNFHGEAVALALDYLAMGLSEVANICERRIEKMMNPVFSELPAFLVKNSGLNSGLMIAHVTAAALASENKYLCHPASIDSIPTSTDKEDHVSMGVTAGRKLLEVLFNVKNVLAIELLCNTQALEFQRPLKTSPALEAVYQRIRTHVATIEEDRVFYRDIQNIVNLINSNELVDVVESIVGELK
ncbi:MAG TPA: histidine ammonia-lyase [Bacteriovoracaceae bacterium]|nr:histidine ammonia-lyase [Bacteriovoracaceae bacterium]